MLLLKLVGRTVIQPYQDVIMQSEFSEKVTILETEELQLYSNPQSSHTVAVPDEDTAAVISSQLNLVDAASEVQLYGVQVFPNTVRFTMEMTYRQLLSKQYKYLPVLSKHIVFFPKFVEIFIANILFSYIYIRLERLRAIIFIPSDFLYACMALLITSDGVIVTIEYLSQGSITWAVRLVDMSRPALDQSIHKIGPSIIVKMEQLKSGSSEFKKTTSPLDVPIATSTFINYLFVQLPSDMAIAVKFPLVKQQEVWGQSYELKEQEMKRASITNNCLFIVINNQLQIFQIYQKQQKLIIEMELVQQLSRSRFTLMGDAQPSITDIGVSKFMKFLQRVAYAETKIEQGRFQIAIQCEQRDGMKNLYESIEQICVGRRHDYGIKIQSFIRVCQMFNMIPKLNEASQVYINILINYFGLELGKPIGLNKFMSILKPLYRQATLPAHPNARKQNKQNISFHYKGSGKNTKSNPSLNFSYQKDRTFSCLSNQKRDALIKSFANFISIFISEYFVIDKFKQQLSNYVQQLAVYFNKKYGTPCSKVLTKEQGPKKLSFLFIDKNRIKQFMCDHQMYNKMTYSKICNYLFGSDGIESVYLQLKKQECQLSRQFSTNLMNSSKNQSNFLKLNPKLKENHVKKEEKDKSIISKGELMQIFERINELETKINIKSDSSLKLGNMENKQKAKKGECQNEYRKITNKIDNQLSKIERKQMNRSFKLPNQRYNKYNRNKQIKQVARLKTENRNKLVLDQDRVDRYRFLTKAQSQATLKIQSIERRAMHKYLSNCYERVSIPQICPFVGHPYLSIEEGLEFLQPSPIYRYYRRVDEYMENEKERAMIDSLIRKDCYNQYKKIGKIRTQF